MYSLSSEESFCRIYSLSRGAFRQLRKARCRVVPTSTPSLNGGYGAERTAALTALPFLANAATTARPRKPEAPVTRTRLIACLEPVIWSYRPLLNCNTFGHGMHNSNETATAIIQYGKMGKRGHGRALTGPAF
jgi:hypothetical protein